MVDTEFYSLGKGVCIAKHGCVPPDSLQDDVLAITGLHVRMHCKNCSVINTPNLLHAHTKNMVEGVSIWIKLGVFITL